MIAEKKVILLECTRHQKDWETQIKKETKDITKECDESYKKAINETKKR